MPSAAPVIVTDPGPAAPVWMLPGVKLFASGEYRGKPWPTSALRLIARNAKRLGPTGEKLLVPPAVLGHEEEQEWLDRTDLPACGWINPDSVRTIPDPKHPGEVILVGDVVNIPDKVKIEKLDSGEFRFGSSEIYDSFVNDFGKRFGKALRRFALLGGDVPQVKRLGSLPAPVRMTAPMQFSERTGVTIRVTTIRRGGTIHHYAETVSMDRQAMLAAVMAAMPNLAQATLEGLTDEQLADLVKNLPAPPTPAAATPDPMAAAGSMFADEEEAAAAETEEVSREEMIAALEDMGQDPVELEAMEDDELGALYDEMTAAEEGGEEEVETMGDPATMPREELIAELVAAGQDAAQLEAMDETALRELYTQIVGGATATAPAAPMPAAMPVMTMGERKRKSQQNRGRVTVLSETKKVARNARKLNNALEGELRRLRVTNHQQKVQDATVFCDKLVSEGRATPALVKAAFLPALLALDNTRAVHKHSENGQTRSLTAYELKKRDLAKLSPIVKFGERFPGGPGVSGKPDGSAEAAKVRQFADAAVPEAYREQYVDTFAELQKKKPRLTAAEYGAK